MNAAATADEILLLYQQFGNNDYIGEPVSQVEHMSQCAQLAIKQGFDDEVVLAAFFHDIGHLLEHVMPVKYMDGYGIADHELLGAEYLISKGFSRRMAALVNSHVNAKRYLTFKYPNYYAALSDASKKTLEFQGGVMTAAEAGAFENEPDFELFIKLRRWDEAAKLEQVPLVDMNQIRERIINHLNSSYELGNKAKTG